MVVGQSLLISAFALHLGLQLGQLVVAHLHVAGPNVARVHKVHGLAYHGAVDAPAPPLQHKRQCCWFSDCSEGTMIHLHTLTYVKISSPPL